MIVQACTYFNHSGRDSKFLKAIVITIILLQVVETATESFAAYYNDAAGWGDPVKIVTNTSYQIANNLQPFFAATTGFIVQCFFTWRIWSFVMASILHLNVRMLIRFVCAFIALVSYLKFGHIDLDSGCKG